MIQYGKPTGLFCGVPGSYELWIIQEAVLARKVLFVCGDWGVDENGLIIPWHIMMADQMPYSNATWEQAIKTDIAEARAINQISLMLNLGMGLVEKQSPSLIDLLQRSRHALATDPRDYVYGLLGLASQPYRDKISVDYTESVGDIYQRVAEIVIELGDGPKLLYNIHGLHSELDLPSWVPDWSIQQVPFFSLAPTPGSASSTIDIPYVCAGGSLTEMHVLHDQKALLCKGYIVDVVERLTEENDEPEDEEVVSRKSSHSYRFLH